MENRKVNLKTTANKSMTNTETGQGNVTAGNKKTMDQGKVLTEATYCHPQYIGPDETVRRHGWNGEEGT